MSKVYHIFCTTQFKPCSSATVATKWIQYLFVVCLLIISNYVLPAGAQKREIAVAREQLKMGKELDKVQNSMEKLLKDSTLRNNEKIWLLLYESVYKQYEQGNEKLYLKQPYDTAQLFTLTQKLFGIAESIDAIEVSNTKMNKAKQKWRKKHAEELHLIRPNLYNGGLFWIRKQNYVEAYRCLDTYIDGAHQPLLRNYDYATKDPHIPQAAYWAMYCGYKLKNSKMALHYAYWALKDTAHYQHTLQYLAETYYRDRDTSRYITTLNEGFRLYPKANYFFSRLIDYYGESNIKCALDYTEELLQKCPSSTQGLLTKTTLLLNMGSYESCISLCDSMMKAGDTIPETRLNMGLAYFNMAVRMDKNQQRFRSNRERMMGYYQKARHYLEEYRQSRPQDTEHWALPLYTIYLNLNMGKEFDEIDRLLRRR